MAARTLDRLGGVGALNSLVGLAEASEEGCSGAQSLKSRGARKGAASSGIGAEHLLR